MADNKTDEPKEKNFFEKLSDRFFHDDAPETQKELLDDLHIAHDRKLLTDDGMHMIEGVMRVNSLRAEDLMVPRTQMIVIDISENSQDWIKQVIAAGHSRFPVIDGDKDNVLGILLAKDLLRLFINPEYEIRQHLRQAVFVPESKPADVLLKEFRLKRNHMALVVDEFGSVSGLITIEDVLEEIVGEIRDEYDIDEVDSIVWLGDREYEVLGSQNLEDLCEELGLKFESEDYDSIGGYVVGLLDHFPKPGESITTEDGVKLIVEAMDKNRVEKIRLILPEPEKEKDL